MPSVILPENWEGVYERILTATETAVENRGQSFYRLSKNSGVDQAALSRCKPDSARTKHRGYKLSSENLLRVLLAMFEPELVDFVGKVETAARKRTA